MTDEQSDRICSCLSRLRTLYKVICAACPSGIKASYVTDDVHALPPGLRTATCCIYIGHTVLTCSRAQSAFTNVNTAMPHFSKVKRQESRPQVLSPGKMMRHINNGHSSFPSNCFAGHNRHSKFGLPLSQTVHQFQGWFISVCGQHDAVSLAVFRSGTWVSYQASQSTVA